jgi:1-deoxy-D-xylulose-5-phosphate reductoisomerase
MKGIAILGSTGSIGKQALEVISAHPDLFSAEILTAYDNATLLIEQAIRYHPNAVVIANENKYEMVREALSSCPVKVFAGSEAIIQIMDMDTIDIVLTAMVGFAGLLPTIRAIETGKDIALANKETLVVAGELINKMALDNHVSIRPVDSEHSAIFQCLSGEAPSTIEKIFLTASGGPFRNFTSAQLSQAGPEEALKHPNWQMGNKITIDSATLMNKGLEVIEAKWLFGLKPGQIEVIIHPQSIIHSMVQFCDGSIKAQMGLPDMKLPIQYALGYPYRIASDFPRLDFGKYPGLSFEPPDFKKFRNLALAYKALEAGGNMPCILNAANEVVVEAFLQKKTGFIEMSDIIERTMEEVALVKKPGINDYIETDLMARETAKKQIKK